VIGGIMERLQDAVDAVTAVDPTSLVDDELVALAVALDRQAQRLARVQARIAAAVESSRAFASDGSKSAAARLARECGRSRSVSARAVRLGRSLREMRLVDDALGSGLIGMEHAEELARCRLVAPDAFAAGEAMLVEFAVTLRFDDFTKACAYWRQVVDPDGSDRDAERAVEARFLRWHRRRDGSVLGEFQLDPVAGAAVLEALERIEQQFLRADWAAATAAHGPSPCARDVARTARQRRADALVELAERACASPPGGRRPEPLVSVYVDYETLAGRLCELADGTVISPGRLLPLLERADLERVVFGPGNRVLELSERMRFFTGGLRRAIQLRDRRCQWPGCDTPAARCDVDHVIPYADGGPTTQANGRLYCGTHNQEAQRRHTRRRATVGPDPP
jgi:hypothetical protein